MVVGDRGLGWRVCTFLDARKRFKDRSGIRVSDMGIHSIRSRSRLSHDS